MTHVVFIKVLNNNQFKKVVTTSERSADTFCRDATEYYKHNSIETVWVENEDNPDFFEVRSCRNGKTMAIAGPEQNQLFWRKHTSIKKDVEEANGVPQKPVKQKHLFYAVISKEFTGYVRLWATCEKFVKGKKGGVKYKGFSSLEAAAVWMRENGAPNTAYQRYKTLKDIK